jgi:hypothetical protein
VIERWLVAIRDHPDRPPALQRLALYSLALRVDWRTGRGFASTQMLADDASAGESTVRRSTKWARDRKLLLQTRRGHYIGPGTVIASEWQLTQPVTGDLLDQSQPVNGDDPTGQRGRPNRSAGMHHQESSTSQPSTSARASAAQGQNQGQDHGSGQIRVGGEADDKEGLGLNRSVANSHKPRVHHGSKDPSSDDQQSGIPVTRQSQAAGRNARTRGAP